MIRRVKQGIRRILPAPAERKDLERAAGAHAEQGWNIGQVPYGYLPEKVTHPNPSKAAQGLTKTRLALDPDRAPVIEQIYLWRAVSKLGVLSIVKLAQHRPGCLPARQCRRPAGTSVAVAAILRNPKYTGYQVFGRTRHGKPVPADQWFWSPAPTHPAIVDRATWDAAQEAGDEHRTSSRDEASPASRPPAAPTCCGPGSGARSAPGGWSAGPKPTATADPKVTTPTTCAPHDPNNPRHVAQAPGHPGTVAARQDLLLAALRGGLDRLRLLPWPQRTAPPNSSPRGPMTSKARTAAQAAALDARIRQITTAQDSLVLDLATLPTDPADTAAQALRARIHAHFTDLHHELQDNRKPSARR